MSARARITPGIGLLVAVLAMSMCEIHWLAALLTFFGLFLVLWGRLPNETEKAIIQLPGSYQSGGSDIRGYGDKTRTKSTHVADLLLCMSPILTPQSSFLDNPLEQIPHCSVL